MWLLSRRIIALAELLGLPRAATTLAVLESADSTASTASSSILPRLEQRARVWESICAIDRITSMICSLPLATGNYPLPQRPLLDASGKIDAQAYLYRLADIASRVLELEGIKAAQKPLSELFSAVIQTDCELRSLASIPGKDWWNSQVTFPLHIEYLLQYWHKYFTVRTHLQLALIHDGQDQQFAFNFVACLEACQDLSRRYVSLRPVAPPGFFANWVIDMQAFTGAVFLQLASYRIKHGFGSELPLHGFNADVVADLVDQVAKAMDSCTDVAGQNFAQQAANVVRSLDSLLRRPSMTETQRISLSLPLIGTIQISRRPDPKAYPGQGQDRPSSLVTHNRPQNFGDEATLFNNGTASASQSDPVAPDIMESTDLFALSMEFPECFPFIPDDTFSLWMQ